MKPSHASRGGQRRLNSQIELHCIVLHPPSASGWTVATRDYASLEDYHTVMQRSEANMIRAKGIRKSVSKEEKQRKAPNAERIVFQDKIGINYISCAPSIHAPSTVNAVTATDLWRYAALSRCRIKERASRCENLLSSRRTA